MDLNMSSIARSFIHLPGHLQLNQSYKSMSNSNQLDNLVKSRLDYNSVRRFDHF